MVLLKEKPKQKQQIFIILMLPSPLAIVSILAAPPNSANGAPSYFVNTPSVVT